MARRASSNLSLVQGQVLVRARRGAACLAPAPCRRTGAAAARWPPRWVFWISALSRFQFRLAALAEACRRCATELLEEILPIAAEEQAIAQAFISSGNQEAGGPRG